MHGSSLSTPHPAPQRCGVLSRLWRGEYPLWKTFWLFSVLVNFCLVMFFAYFDYLTVAMPLWFARMARSIIDVIGVSAWVGFFVVLAGLVFIYSFVVLVGLWRSASKYTGPKVWAVLAKVIVVLSAMRMVSELAKLASQAAA